MRLCRGAQQRAQALEFLIERAAIQVRAQLNWNRRKIR